VDIGKEVVQRDSSLILQPEPYPSGFTASAYPSGFTASAYPSLSSIAETKELHR
jgi:hypothetical protein